MKKFSFVILLLLPLITFGQAEKRYRSIIVDSLKALNGGRVDVKDTLLLDSLAVYNTDLSSQYTSRSLVDSAFVGKAVSSGSSNTIYSADDNLAGNRIVTQGANTLDFTLTAVDGFSIDGTTFSVDGNNNRVGIGTAAPITALTVHGTATLSSPGLNIRTFAEFKRTSGVDAYLRIGDRAGNNQSTIYGRSDLNSLGLTIIGELGSGRDVASNTGVAVIQLVGLSDGGGVVNDASTLFSLINGTRKKWQVLGNGNTMFAGDFDPQVLTPEALLDLPNTSNLAGLLVRANSIGLLDGQVLNSPTFEIRGSYDSDPTGGITEAEFDATMQTFVTVGGVSAEGRLAISIEGGEALSVDQTQKTTLFGIDATSTNSVFLAEDNVGTNLLQVRNDGQVISGGEFSTTKKDLTLGIGAVTFITTSNVMQITGDGAGNTLATITGALSGQYLIMIFVDNKVTITDDNGHGANTIDLSAAFTSLDDTTLHLIYDGTSWYEISRSVN